MGRIVSLALTLTFALHGFLGLLGLRTLAQGPVAPKPLFRDPVHDGAADPTLIWNRARHEWWMFYTNRRADEAPADPKDVSWLHGTRIGIAVSRDGGAHWKYRGEAAIRYGPENYTQWAPEIIWANGRYHMFLTIVPGTFSDWNHPREIVHFVSPDLVHWSLVGRVHTSSDKTIDPSVVRLPSGGWRMWFKDEQDGSHIHYADSRNLTTWTPSGVAIADRNSEGPKVFQWKGRWWLIVDTGKGLAVYHSTDLLHWVPQHTLLLDRAGTLPTDRSYGHHCDVVVHGDRAWIFYFTHQEGADQDPSVPHSRQRTVLQVAELKLGGDVLTADRDAVTHVDLGPGQTP